MRSNVRKANKRTVRQNVDVMVTNLRWKFNEAIAHGLSGIGNAILLASPFLMLIVGEYVYQERGYWAVGGEVFLVILLVALGFGLRSYARVSGNASEDIPVPYRRFTRVDYDSGRVDVDYDRVQEMILYVADLEDWFDRNGYGGGDAL